MLCTLPGCKLVRKWFSPAEQATLGDPNPIERMSDATLSDPDSRQGLEVRMLVVDDTNYDTARMLNALVTSPEAQSQFDEQTLSTWSQWGFRLVAIPLDQLDSSLAALTPVRPLSVQWLGEFGAWRPLVRTGESRQTVVRVGESSRTIEHGRPRLIARSWSAPMLGDNGVERGVRVDLGIQIESSKRSTFELLPDQKNHTLDDEGQVIDELLSTFTLDGRYAIMIVGEVPGADWGNLPEPAPLIIPDVNRDQDVGPNADEDQESGLMPKESVPFSSPSRGAIEPSVPSMRSLGELMLVAPGSRLMRQGESRNIPKRVVIVLVPSAQGSFQMLSIPSSRGGGAS